MHNDAVDAVLLSPGKALTDPLLLLLAAAVLLTVLAGRGRRRALAPLLLLALLSTGATAHLLEWTLLPGPAAGDLVPEVIVVPSGGSLEGATPELDILTESSEERIVAGAFWWRRHPAARLILTGADQTPRGASTRTLALMRETALRLGVPAAAITVEGQSFNTREHAMRIAALPGITRMTRIGLVTSRWHLRRARGAFARHFTTVIPLQPPRRARPLTINDVLPGSSALRATTRLLHEWLGIAWYALRR